MFGQSARVRSVVEMNIPLGQHAAKETPEVLALQAMVAQLADLVAAVREPVTGSLTINLNVSGRVDVVVTQLPPPPGPARHVRLTLKRIQGEQMGNMTVDTVGETATVEFLDDHQDVTSAPDGAVVNFSSSNESVATIVADPANPLVGNVTPVAMGDVTLSANVVGADGNPVLEPDGVTPFSATADLTVAAGPANTLALVLNN